MKSLGTMLSRLRNVLPWMFAIDDPGLADDEGVLMDTIGSRIQGIFVPQGRMMLTTRRLIIMPAYIRIFPKCLYPWRRVDIQLAEVAGVSKGSWLDRLRGIPGMPAFVLHSRDGKRYIFQTFHWKAWQDEIEKLIGAKS
jgi:hypothetical protein